MNRFMKNVILASIALITIAAPAVAAPQLCQVPDAGNTLVLIGAAGVALTLVRRFLK
jgi:hypothetical protein